MDNLFRWAVILILALLTLNVVTAEFIEVGELQKPVEIVTIKKKEVVQPKKIAYKAEQIVGKEYSTREVQLLINKYAEKHGVDKDRAKKIAGCESGFRWNAKSSQSTAGGVFQFLESTRRSNSKRYGRGGESRFDADANIDVAIQKLKNEGWSAWTASKHCWNR